MANLARAIQVSIVHVTLGVAAGSLIEAVLPSHSDDASAAAQVFEALVQISLNGVLLASVAATLMSDDPTYGIPFSMGLHAAQPALNSRLAVLSDAARLRIAQFSPQTL